MTVTDKFKDDSARAAIRALRGLEQTAVMLERWAPDVFPEVNEQGQKHFGRVMMESAAQSIRDAWAQAIKDAENSQRAEHVAELEHLRDLLSAYVADEDRFNKGNGEPYGSISTETGMLARAALKRN